MISYNYTGITSLFLYRGRYAGSVFSTTIAKSIDFPKGYDNQFGYRQPNGLQQPNSVNSNKPPWSTSSSLGYPSNTSLDHHSSVCQCSLPAALAVRLAFAMALGLPAYIDLSRYMT